MYEQLNSIYIRLKKRAPRKLIGFIKRFSFMNRIVSSIKLDSFELCTLSLGEPLKGHRMKVPKELIYPFVWGEHEKHVCNLILELVKPGWTIIDIGAHVGYYSLLFAKQVGPQGHIFSFEPLQQNEKLLHENIAMNNYEDIIEVVPMAVSDRTELQKLYLDGSTSQAFIDSATREVGVDIKSCIVPCCSVDDFFMLLGWPPIDLIKIDIEGAETKAIIGMKNVIKMHRPLLIIESHGEIAREGLDRLLRQGYKAHFISKEGLREMILEDHLLGNEHILMIP